MIEGTVKQAVLPVPYPKFDLGQHARISRGIDRGVSGQVIACEWSQSDDCWLYVLKTIRGKLGPFRGSELY
jgi:hypothetical protein